MKLTDATKPVRPPPDVHDLLFDSVLREVYRAAHDRPRLLAVAAALGIVVHEGDRTTERHEVRCR